MGNYTGMYCHDNCVYLKLNKKINDNKFLMNMIEIFSKEDEIIFYNYNSSNDILSLIYRCNKSKFKMFQRKFFIYSGYEFHVEEGLSQKDELFDVSIDSIVLNNIDKSIDNESIEAYVNYLVQNNTIKKVDASKLIEETLYIQFEKYVDFNGLLRRHRITPQFCGKNVKVYQTMETFMVLVKLNFDSKTEQEIHDYLVNTFQINNEICWQSFDHFSRIPIIIVKFVSLDMKKKFLSQIVQNLESDFIECVEDVLNIHLLNDFIKSIESKADDKKIEYNKKIFQVQENEFINRAPVSFNLKYEILSSIQSEGARILNEEINDDVNVKLEKIYNCD